MDEGGSNCRDDMVQKLIYDRTAEMIRGSGEDYWLIVRENVFAVPHLDGFLLFSPLQGLVLLITRAGLASLLLNPDADAPISDCLVDCVIDGELERVRDFDRVPFYNPGNDDEAIEDFRPTRLTLSLTSECQLSCSYCYIHGGDNPRHMPWEIAKAGIKFVGENITRKEKDVFALEFHGQGEPTANWPLFKNAVLLVEQECRERSLKPDFSIVTNGILSESKIKFIVDHKIGIGLSLDGLKKTTDTQRPLRNGKSSFDRIMKSIELFEKHNADFTIRSTVTWLNLPEMKEFVEFVKKTTSCDYVNFEPVCIVGRAVDNHMNAENLIPKFIESFKQAKQKGLESGIDVAYSPVRLDGLRNSFCGAYGGNLNFCISTDGLISSCYEVLDNGDPRAKLFIYGYYHQETKTFKFFKDRIEGLLDINSNTIGRCKDCFVKWTCGGDCLSKAALRGIEHLLGNKDLERCTASRQLTQNQLWLKFLEAKKKEVYNGKKRN